jgi:hypothetical protein
VTEHGDHQARWLLFAWSPSGYRLHERGGAVPPVGGELELDGQRLEIVKIAASPLPGDGRICVYSAGA